MAKFKTFEVAKKEISEKFPYLILLKFNGNDKEALFFDKEYGEFYAKYVNVQRGFKSHRGRALYNKLEKTTKTNLEKYGVKNVFQCEKIKSKIKETNIQKYGKDHYFKIKSNLKKREKSTLEKYGVKHTLQLESVKDKIKETNLKKYGVEYVTQSKEIKNKIKDIVLEKYGVENISQLEETKNKKIETSIKKYGVKHPMQSKEVLNSRRANVFEKYGVEHTLQLELVKNKIKETVLSKYGVPNVSKSDQIKSKIENSMIEKYGAKSVLQIQKFKDNIKNKNISNNIWYNIGGKTLREYYSNSILDLKISYSCIQSNYKKYGDKALSESFYKQFSGKSKIANLWLKMIEHKIGYELNREFHIPNTMYHADGYDPNTNTIYEFYGDFWHGNLEKFNANKINPIKKVSYKELYDKTIARQDELQKLGHIVVSIWESDFINLTNSYC